MIGDSEGSRNSIMEKKKGPENPIGGVQKEMYPVPDQEVRHP